MHLQVDAVIMLNFGTPYAKARGFLSYSISSARPVENGENTIHRSRAGEFESKTNESLKLQTNLKSWRRGKALEDSAAEFPKTETPIRKTRV